MGTPLADSTETKSTAQRAERFARQVAARHSAPAGGEGAEVLSRRPAAPGPQHTGAGSTVPPGSTGDGVFLARLARARRAAEDATPAGQDEAEAVDDGTDIGGASQEQADPYAVADEVYALMRRELISGLERRGWR